MFAGYHEMGVHGANMMMGLRLICYRGDEIWTRKQLYGILLVPSPGRAHTA